jgi:hypothetical protein
VAHAVPLECDILRRPPGKENFLKFSTWANVMRNQLKCLRSHHLLAGREIPADFELLYPGTIDLKWLFPPEKATFNDATKATQIRNPL